MCIFAFAVGGISAAYAACASPAGQNGDIVYNTDYKTYQYCDGTEWWSMKSGLPKTPPAGSVGGSDGQVQFNKGGVLGGSSNLVWDKTNNRLGIGTATPALPLHVVGEIKVGDSGAACGAGNEGALRYNTTSNLLELCNGTSWTTELGKPGFKSVQVFTADGTWTRPAGITRIKVTVVAGGGGGGGGHSSDVIYCGGGGGAGGACFNLIDVTSVSSVAVTVGAGGAAGSGGACGTNGGSGSESKFGTYCSATGGGGGNRNCGSDAPAGSSGGLGGAGSGGLLNLTGGGGQPYRGGGDSIFGGGGKAGDGHTTFGGAGGSAGYGAGGGSSCGGNAAGAGGRGIVIVEEYTD